MHGIKVSRGGPAVSHLLFADDLFIFCRASASKASSAIQCINSYGEWSGQAMNLDKSRVHFSKNYGGSASREICSILNLRKMTGSEIYLGLPLFMGKSKKQVFTSIVEKVHNRICGWKARTLSQAGRATLIRSTTSSIPNYVMSTFLLPATICLSLDSRYRNFWWRFSKENGRGLCLKVWDSICKPKAVGGLGFRRADDMNRALIAKMGWHLFLNSNKFWVKLLYSKYCCGISFSKATYSYNDSWLWKGIIKCKDLVI